MSLKKIINHKPRLVITALISCIVYFLYGELFLNENLDLAIKVKNENSSGIIISHNNDQVTTLESKWSGNTEHSEFINEMVRNLKQRHAHEINLVSVQASLKDLQSFILERYPQDGEAIFKFIITQAFQLQSKNILALIYN